MVPRITSLIRSMTTLVLQFARFANQFSPLKSIEIPTINLFKVQKTIPQIFFCVLKQKMCRYKANNNYKNKILSTLDLTDPDLTDFGFNGFCLLADNQPKSGLKSVNVKESPVGGGRVGNIIR